jgi:hypothetical protein
MSYLDALQTKLLATHCCVCGRPLCDSVSVTVGMGPDCRGEMLTGVDPETQRLANQLTWAAAIHAQKGNVVAVRTCAEAIRRIGLERLSDRILERFVDAEERAVITVREEGDSLVVTTPYRRGMGEEFKQAWRAVPGRRWNGKENVVPRAQRAALWDLLGKFFPGKYGVGPQGAFRVPGGGDEQ